jgi:hypothetical protein
VWWLFRNDLVHQKGRTFQLDTIFHFGDLHTGELVHFQQGNEDQHLPGGNNANRSKRNVVSLIYATGLFGVPGDVFALVEARVELHVDVGLEQELAHVDKHQLTGASRDIGFSKKTTRKGRVVILNIHRAAKAAATRGCGVESVLHLEK